jgi:ribosomal protein L16 Arg81 hydroxylase
MTEREFFAEHYDRKPAHIVGGAEKFSSVISWDGLTGILNMTAAWSSASLQLVLDRNVVPPRNYCRKALSRDGLDVLQPDADKVMALLSQGASLVANDIDTLTPGLRGVAAALEKALSGKAQANLYCSWKERQAFGTHFDTHDVYAMHIAGEKLWRIYETRADNPIAHPQFKSYGQEWHDANKGEVAQEILMRPGDLLYIPRGLYHDAIATSDGTIHIAFGVTHVIGMDAMDMFTSMTVDDPLFRCNMPRPADGEAAVAEWLGALGARIADFAKTPEAVQAMVRHQRDFRYPRGGFALPVARQGQRYRLSAKDLKVERRDGAWMLTGARGSVPVPEGLDGPVSWVVGRKGFTDTELYNSFPAVPHAELDKLLNDLAGMKVVARCP